jgi:lipid-binding SYLF domain-containing protein
MKKWRHFLTASLMVVLAVGTAHGGWNPNAEKEARETLAKFQEANPDTKAFLEAAYGYAVFPSVGKGGVGIGGSHGSGTVFEKGKAIGATTLTQLSIGFQFGGQVYSELIVFKDKAALDRFTAGNFEFNAQATGVAITAGISFDAAYSNGVAVFTMAKGGLMYEASVGGQKFSYEAK